MNGHREAGWSEINGHSLWLNKSLTLHPVAGHPGPKDWTSSTATRHNAQLQGRSEAT